MKPPVIPPSCPGCERPLSATEDRRGRGSLDVGLHRSHLRRCRGEFAELADPDPAAGFDTPTGPPAGPFPFLTAGRPARVRP